MRYPATREVFKRDIEENLGFRDMDVTNREDEYKVVIYVMRPAFDRMCERAEQIKEKWENDGYTVDISTDRTFYSISLTLEL